MGVYDTLHINCPGCGQKHSFQSKADYAPYLNDYTIADSPKCILGDVADRLKEEPAMCECGTVYTLKCTAVVEILKHRS